MSKTTYDNLSLNGLIPSQVVAVSSFVPQRVVSNEEISELTNSTPEWIVSRTGIESRRYALENQDVAFMASQAASELVVNPIFTNASTRAIIVATVTHDHVTPSAAAYVANMLHLDNVAVFDVQSACAGFSYGLEVARALIGAGSFESIIVIGADKISGWTDTTDRSGVPLVSDGAGGFLVTRSDTTKISPAFLGSDTTLIDLIRDDCSFSESIHRPDVTYPQLPHITMEGTKVFKWALNNLPGIVESIVAKSGFSLEDIDVFVPHQANLRITNAIVERCAFREDIIVADSIRYYGNNSSASIPMAIARLENSGLLLSGSKVLMVGFGSGMVFSGQVVTF